MADHSAVVKVPMRHRIRMQAEAAAQHVGGMQVVKTAAEMGIGYVGARAVSQYIERSGALDKTITDVDNRRYARAGILAAAGALMVLKTKRARVAGMGVILEAVAEVVIPPVNKFVDENVTPEVKPPA